MPAVVRRTDGSYDGGTSDADGTRRCPRSSKNDRKRSRISAALIAWSLGGEGAGQPCNAACKPSGMPAVTCNFRPDPCEGCARDGDSAPKGMHSGCTHASGSRLIRRSILMLLAERMVGEARVRRARQMPKREAVVRGVSAVVFLLVAAVIASVLPTERETGPILVFSLIVGYAVVSRVRFEFGNMYVVPEQLLLVTMLALAPLPIVPFMVAAGAVLGVIPDFARGMWHWDRTITTVGDCWFVIGPVLVLAALSPGTAELGDAEVYALAYLAQVGGDLVWTLLRDRLIDRVPMVEVLRYFAGCARVDAILSPLAFLVAVSAADAAAALLAIAPLVWLLEIFSRDRRERYAAALELNRAYRGTVMLLSDVLEFEDEYTAQHSRSVV